MRHGGKVAICLAGGLALHTGAPAATADSPGNPYSGIVDRNVFALKPVPPPPPPVDTTVTPPQKIVLTGIVKAFGKKQVFFKTPVAGKPDASYMLSEGERAGEIEILEINEVAGTVQVKNHNIPQSLSLEKDGMKPPGVAGGGPGALPAVPGMGVPGMGVTGGAAPGASLTPVPNFGGGGAASVQRPLRVVPPQTANSPGQPNARVQSQTLSHEEQVVLMEINRKLTAEKVAKGEMPPLPDTPFTPKPVVPQ